MPNGYTGKILFVDLTTGTIKEESPPEQKSRQLPEQLHLMLSKA